MSIPRKKSVTAKDIARVCGISQATVSYVMNNKEGKKISEATRQLVLKTARELNYVPNSTARSMRTNRSMSIGVVSGRNNLTIGFSHILRGIKEYLDKAGYSITLLTDDGRERLKDSPEQHEYVRYYRSSRIDGILFLFYEMEDSVMKMLEEEHIPFFLVDESGVWCGSQQQHTLLEEGIAQAVTLCREKRFLNLGFFSSQFGDTLFSRKWGLFSRLLAENHPCLGFRLPASPSGTRLCPGPAAEGIPFVFPFSSPELFFWAGPDLFRLYSGIRICRGGRSGDARSSGTRRA